MEPKKYFKVQATLERCCYSDVYSRGNLLEHRMFYVADEVSKEMKATWTINDTSRYEREMLFTAIVKGLLFKLCELHTGLNFHFSLIIRQAENYDLIYTAEQLKVDATYYILGDHNAIIGPLYIHESDDPFEIKTLIKEGKLFVPTRKQLFEAYVKQHSA